MAIMLNMTDVDDGFPSTRILSFNFTLYNQTIAHAVTEVLLWHVSCEMPLTESKTN
jgi:hypothetical protein